MSQKLLYRVVPHNGGVVFAEPDRARFIAKIHTAINSSTTWGEFQAALPESEYVDLVRKINYEVDPKTTDAFSGELLPGWTDGDYPPWLQKEMGQILPRSILEQFGISTQTAINGNFWFISEENISVMCAALNACGWEVECAQELNFH